MNTTKIVALAVLFLFYTASVTHACRRILYDFPTDEACRESCVPQCPHHYDGLVGVCANPAEGLYTCLCCEP